MERAIYLTSLWTHDLVAILYAQPRLPQDHLPFAGLTPLRHQLDQIVADVELIRAGSKDQPAPIHPRFAQSDVIHPHLYSVLDTYSGWAVIKIGRVLSIRLQLTNYYSNYQSNHQAFQPRKP